MASNAAQKVVELRTARKIVGQLRPRDKIVLLKELREETWQTRFDAAIRTMRRAVKERPISDEEIRRECEAVRKELYDRKVRQGGR